MPKLTDEKIKWLIRTIYCFVFTVLFIYWGTYDGSNYIALVFCFLFSFLFGYALKKLINKHG